MHSLILDSLGAKILIQTDSGKLQNYLLHSLEIKSLLPELKVYNDEKSTAANFRIVYTQKNTKQKFVMRNNEIIINDPDSRLSYSKNDLELIFFLMLVFEHIYSSKHIHGLYAGCVTRKDGKAVLITGPGNTGKSLVCATLCMQYGYELFGDDRVGMILDKNHPCVIGGNIMIGMRAEAIGILPKSRFRYAKKHGVIRIKPDELGISRRKTMAKVKAVYEVRITTFNSVRNASKFEKRLIVYRDITHRKENMGFPLIDLEPNNKIADAWRKDALAAAFDAIPVYKISGNLKFVTLRINNMLES